LQAFVGKVFKHSRPLFEKIARVHRNSNVQETAVVIARRHTLIPGEWRERSARHPFPRSTADSKLQRTATTVKNSRSLPKWVIPLRTNSHDKREWQRCNLPDHCPIVATFIARRLVDPR